MKNKNHTDEENPSWRRRVVSSRVIVILVCVLLFHNPLCTLAGPLAEPQIGLHGVALGLGAKHSSRRKRSAPLKNQEGHTALLQAFSSRHFSWSPSDVTQGCGDVSLRREPLVFLLDY